MKRLRLRFLSWRIHRLDLRMERLGYRMDWLRRKRLLLKQYWKISDGGHVCVGNTFTNEKYPSSDARKQEGGGE